MPRVPRRHPGLSLVELLVSLSLIAVLMSLLVPMLAQARHSAMRTTCMAQQRQLGIAIHNHAHDHRGTIPFGPTAPPVTITNLYLYTGHVTNLVSLHTGQPVGLGLLLEPYLAQHSHALFCPANDQPIMTEQEIEAIGRRQVQGSYFYRHGSVVEFSYPPDTGHIRLADLGMNRQGRPIRALVMDGNLLAPPQFNPFGIFTRTNHRRRDVNVLYADGRVRTLSNAGDRFTIDLAVDPHRAPHRMLEALEFADSHD